MILAWGVALLWLLLRNTGQTDQSRIAQQASLRLAPGDAWFRVMAGDLQIGYAGVTLDTLSTGRFRIQEQVAIDLPSDSALTRAIRSSEITLGSTFTVESFGSRLSGVGHLASHRGSAEAGGWRVELMNPAGGTNASGLMQVIQPGRPQPVAPMPLRVVPLRLALVGALAAGDGRNLPIATGWPPVAWNASVSFDGDSSVIFADSSEMLPTDSTWQVVRVDTVQARALLIDSPEGPVRLQVDDRGTLVGVEYAFGVRWLRDDFDVARFNYGKALDSLAGRIRATLPILVPHRGDGAAASVGDVGTTYQVSRRDGSPIRGGLLALVSEGRQQVVQGNLVIRAAPMAGRRDLRARLADPLAQTDSSSIEELSRQAPDDTSGAAFASWVASIRERVTLDYSPGAAQDAAGALASGRARPEGLARVIVAALNRQGHNARIAIGVRPGEGDTLHTHAWVEYSRYRQGSWRALDPFTGLPLDTRWVRISYGGSTAPGDLLPLVADVRFTPVAPGATEEGEAP